MATKTTNDAAKYIRPLNMNGLHGRMLRLPPPKLHQREILFVYGHHSSLERWWGMVQDLNQYGGVTMPDLPGFGGMDSFYKIGKKPTVDNLADYLAAFIKLRYRRQKVTLAGLSFGFVVITRMLQRYPQLNDQVDMLVSVVGFSHKDDFSFSKVRYWGYRLAAKTLANPLGSSLFSLVALNRFVLRHAYSKTHNAKHKFANLDGDQHRQMVDFEIYLWHANDVRTWLYTTNQFLKLDNCTRQLKLPLLHVSVKADRYFDQQLVLQHLRVIFSKVTVMKSSMQDHAPSVIADIETATPLLPKKLRQMLAK